MHTHTLFTVGSLGNWSPGLQTTNLLDHWGVPQLQGFYLIVFPVPEEIDRAVFSPLKDSPAAVVQPLLTPSLDQPVTVLCL